MTVDFPAINNNPVIPKIINPLPSKIIPPEIDELKIVISPTTNNFIVTNTPTKTRAKKVKIKEIQTIKKENIITIAANVSGIPIGAARTNRIAIKKVLEILFSPK